MNEYPLLAVERTSPGHASLSFCCARGKTVVASALASSPLRLLTPRNHGDAAWVYLSNLGGGLVDGDGIDIRLDAAQGTSAVLATQSTTKVYRSPRGCSQRIVGHIADDAALAMIPDAVVCFAGAKYAQEIELYLAPSASILVLDGYTCGRSARGERWSFSRYASRMTITRAGAPIVIDSTRLDPVHGPLAHRMGRFDAVLSLFAIGPRFAPVRDAMLAGALVPLLASSTRADVIVAASPIGADGAVVRVAAERLEGASRALRSSLAALAGVLGDDPFARKW